MTELNRVNNNETMFDYEIKTLSDGMVLNKLNAKKNTFVERRYNLDLINYQIVATTKEFRKKEKTCNRDDFFFFFDEVKMLLLTAIYLIDSLFDIVSCTEEDFESHKPEKLLKTLRNRDADIVYYFERLIIKA